VFAVKGNADGAGVFKRVVKFLPTGFQPVQKCINGRNFTGQIDFFLSNTGAFSYPCKVRPYYLLPRFSRKNYVKSGLSLVLCVLWSQNYDRSK